MYKLEVQDLHKRYGSHEVLKGVSLAAKCCPFAAEGKRKTLDLHDFLFLDSQHLVDLCHGLIGGLQPMQQAGFHIHERGDCSAVDASSAGNHFNPGGAAHGRAGTGKHHLGDMDNLRADAQGRANVDIHLKGVTLGGGAATDIAGRALVVHANADDYRSQPAGNAGVRIACGVIRVVR